MIVIYAVIVLLFVFADDTAASGKKKKNEDQRIINETLSKYGPVFNYKALYLPGPQFAVDLEKFVHSNTVLQGDSGSLTLRMRTITEHFSYNGRYEESKTKKINDQEIPIVKGQFGEHFVRKSGGYYIRTISYTLDENGYKQFLIDLSKAQTTIKEGELPDVNGTLVGGGWGGSGGSGGSGGNKKQISTIVLNILVSGGTG